MDKLTKSIEVWSTQRGLDKNDPNKQYLKVVEEVGEIAASMARNKEDELKDAIGDTYVTLVILSQQYGWSIKDCVAQAYDEIKDRQGLNINGVFVKSEDLNERRITKTKRRI